MKRSSFIFSVILHATIFGLIFVGSRSGNSYEYRIREDRGGSLVKYVALYQDLERARAKIIIDGYCASACTVVLSVDPNLVCATERAKFGFHAAWYEDNGHRVYHQPATEYLMRMYPRRVTDWIMLHGGLSEKMIYAKGSAFVRPCQ